MVPFSTSMNAPTFDRRAILAAGTLQIGLLPTSVRASVNGGSPRARACILIFLDGGPSQIDLLDPKPDAPGEVRSPFRPIRTSADGVEVTDLLPLTARQMHHCCVVRSMHHQEMVHDPAVYQALTGRPHRNTGGNLVVDPTDFPQIGTVFQALSARPSPLPKAIELPETMKMGGRVLPGQGAGFLGAPLDPYRIQLSSNGVPEQPDLVPSPSNHAGRGVRRSQLLALVDRAAAPGREASDFTELQRKALDLLSRSDLTAALDLGSETQSTRERYGRHRHGQSLLMARRLVERGAPFVSVYWGKEEQDWADGKGRRLANNPWDTHRNHFPLVRDDLTPRADQALSALLVDLGERGLLDSTLVLWMGEFGRSPLISDFASREHWPYAYSLLLAGAGVPEGTVWGKTDAWAGQIVENPVTPADLAATVLALMGVDPHTALEDRFGHRHLAASGRPISHLMGRRAAG